MAKNPPTIHLDDEIVENPAPASAALVLSNPNGNGAPALNGKGKGVMGYVNATLPMLKVGAGIAGGYIGSNVLRGQVSARVAGTLFGDKVSANQALLVDWVFQLAVAITAYKFLPKAVGISIAGGMIGNTVIASATQLMAPKPGEVPNFLQKNLPVLAFRNTPSPAAAGIMPRVNRALSGIMPKVMRY